jgi:hypothetical protein
LTDEKVTTMLHSTTQTPLWTIAFTEPGSDEVLVAVVGACTEDDARRRAADVLGADATIVWAEPRHEARAA